MVESIIHFLAASAMTVLWLVAGLMAGGLLNARDNKNFHKWRAYLTAASMLAFVIGVVWCLLVAYTYIRYGWWFVEGTIKVSVPVMLPGLLGTAVYTLPRLRELKHLDMALHSEDIRAKAAHPLLVLPIYAAAFASGLNIFHSIFAQPVLPGLFDIALPLLLLAVALAAPSLLAKRKHDKVQRGQFALQPLWKVAVKGALALIITAAALFALFVVNLFVGMNASKLPEASAMMDHHLIDEGGGTPTMMSGHHMHEGHSSMVEVADLTGDISEPAAWKFELVAQRKEITLTSGAKIDAWTYNGQLAPELRVRQGDMVEVKLLNKDIDKGITIHWHGYNVPNAMDGVPGMTQNVVKPGQSFTYKFRAEQAGTYWFHSHQLASEQVEKGLFGVLIVDPRSGTKKADEEFIVINHEWTTDQGEITAFGYEDQTQMKRIAPGKKVKLRIINTDNLSRKYKLQGADYRIMSIDGVDIEAPDTLSGRTAFRLASGGRYEAVFTMPDKPVFFKIGEHDEEGPAMIFYTGEMPPENYSFEKDEGLFDPSDYGKPVVNELTAASEFDREFRFILGNKMGFYNGGYYFLWTINGEVYPEVPTLIVKEGEKIKTTFINKSFAEHPMHLHGHHMTVLKKNGKKVETPWLTDSLNVYSGESYEVAFIADNPGMWMDHCHNLDHAATGMVLHLMYDHVLPSYEVGTRSGNLPD